MGKLTFSRFLLTKADYHQLYVPLKLVGVLPKKSYHICFQTLKIAMAMRRSYQTIVNHSIYSLIEWFVHPTIIVNQTIDTIKPLCIQQL